MTTELAVWRQRRCARDHVRLRNAREVHGEDRSPPGPALDRDRAAVRLGDPLGDREPEAGAWTVARARARWIGAPETLEDVREITGGDADPGVSDGQAHPAVGLGEAQVD